MEGSNRACFVLQLGLSGMLHAYWRLLLFPYLGSLSFFNSHPSNRVSFSFFRLKSFRSSPFRKRPPARLCGRSWACVLVSFSILQLCVSILCDGQFLELTAGFDLAPFRKNVSNRLYVLPQDHVPWLSKIKLPNHSYIFEFDFERPRWNMTDKIQRPTKWMSMINQIRKQAWSWSTQAWFWSKPEAKDFKLKKQI